LLLFKLLDTFADRRLVHFQPLSRFACIQFFRHHQNDFQLPGVDVGSHDSPAWNEMPFPGFESELAAGRA
jgi:hypothetical protein